MLSAEDLLAHARDAARADEQRHDSISGHARCAPHSEDTVRGWGGAALRDLEWLTHQTYSRVQQQDYRRAYADEYRRLWSERAAEPGAFPA